MSDQLLKSVSKSTLERKERALRWFFNETKLHFDKVDPRAMNVVKKNGIFLGGLFHFLYDPKYKDSLPYWDKLPLVFPIDIYSDGFMGINIHYLNQKARAQLLDILISNYEKAKNKGKYTERRYLDMNYTILKSSRANTLIQPCIKRYLYNHIKSSFIKVTPDYWEEVALLPTQSFNVNTNKVWK